MESVIVALTSGRYFRFHLVTSGSFSLFGSFLIDVFRRIFPVVFTHVCSSLYSFIFMLSMPTIAYSLKRIVILFLSFFIDTICVLFVDLCECVGCVLRETTTQFS